MGTTVYPPHSGTAAELIRNEIEWHHPENPQRHEVVAHSGRYWAVRTIATGEVFAVVAIVTRHNAQIGIKLVDEGMGPNDYKCPLRILNLLSPTDSKYANEWREQCRKYHADRKAQPRLKVGDTVIFDPPVVFTSGAKVSRMVWHGKYRFDAGGFFARMPKNWRTRYTWDIV